MKKAMVVLAVLSFAGSLWAADPIIGTWKLNWEKSKISPNGPAIQKEQIPKEMTETYRELSNGRIELTVKDTAIDGSSEMSVFTYPIQGGIVEVQNGDTSRSYVQTRIAQDEWYVTILEDGKQIRTRHKKISKDGKIMRQTYRGMYYEGKPFELLQVFDKQ